MLLISSIVSLLIFLRIDLSVLCYLITNYLSCFSQSMLFDRYEIVSRQLDYCFFFLKEEGLVYLCMPGRVIVVFDLLTELPLFDLTNLSCIIIKLWTSLQSIKGINQNQTQNPQKTTYSALYNSDNFHLIIQNKRAMLEDDLLGNNAPRRQLTNQDDLEEQMDHNYVQQERDLKNKVLFSIQGLGGVRAIERQGRQFEAYIKGDYCEESVRDLVKFIRRDSPYNPKTRLILADYNIIESDLLKLLPIQVDDKKLSFWIIALLALMTAKPIDDLNPQELSRINRSLRAYKQSFIDRQCFEILILHMADFYKTPEENRTRAHIQMQQFIILLIRNLAQIPNDEQNPRLHNHFLAALIKEQILHPILYIIQNDTSSFREKIDVPLLEILYYFFTCFDPETIYPSKKTKDKNAILTSILANKKTAGLPSRHSRFLPHFTTNTMRGVKKLTFKMPKQNCEQEDAFKGQRKAPVRMVDYKKVVPLELEKFGSDFMTLHFESEGVTKALGEIATLQIEQFLQVQFQILVKLIFNDIFKQSAKVSDNNTLQYLLLCSWALQMVRARYRHARVMASSQQQKSNVKFELSWIVEVMQNAHFELIYKILYQEVTHEKKKMFKINLFNAAIKLFSSYLEVVDDLSGSMAMSDRKNANVLMTNIFRHDIARIIRSGFQLVSHQGIISNLVRLTHKFFKLLTIYADGKVLTMTTNRMVKRRKKQYSDEEGELQMQNANEEEENDKKRNREDEGRFQERKYNEKSEFAVLAEYSIITKYLSLLKNQRFLHNTAQMNDAIFFYFFQIKKLLQGQWLFFQAEALCIFQLILSNHQWVRNNKEKGKFIQGICLAFIKLLRKNDLALVESLFKYNSLSLKDQILKNYQEGYEEEGEPEENMFTDD